MVESMNTNRFDLQLQKLTTQFDKALQGKKDKKYETRLDKALKDLEVFMKDPDVAMKVRANVNNQSLTGRLKEFSSKLHNLGSERANGIAFSIDKMITAPVAGKTLTPDRFVDILVTSNESLLKLTDYSKPMDSEVRDSQIKLMVRKFEWYLGLASGKDKSETEYTGLIKEKFFAKTELLSALADIQESFDNIRYDYPKAGVIADRIDELVAEAKPAPIAPLRRDL